MNDELLIETVRIYSVLYDLSNPKYMDSRYKNNIRNEIGQKLNYEGSTCKSRWCNIRDQYKRSLMKAKTKSGQSSKKVNKYKYHELLSFLNPYFQERPTITNVSATDDSDIFSNHSQDSTLARPESSMDQFSCCGSPDTPSILNEQLSRPSTSKINNPDSPESRASSSLSTAGKKEPTRSSAASLMEYVLKKNHEKKKHPVDKFFEGVAPTLKSLTPYFQNLAKSEIFNIVQKYELKMFTENRELSTVIQTVEMDALQKSDNTQNLLLNDVLPNVIVNDVLPNNNIATETNTEAPQEQDPSDLIDIRDYIVRFEDNN